MYICIYVDRVLRSWSHMVRAIGFRASARKNCHFTGLYRRPEALAAASLTKVQRWRGFRSNPKGPL